MQSKCGCSFGPQLKPPVALSARSGVDNTAAAAARRAALSPGGEGFTVRQLSAHQGCCIWLGAFQLLVLLACSRGFFLGSPALLCIELEKTLFFLVCCAGPVTQRFLAPHPVILQIGSTVFVHGGVLPAHAAYGVDRINAETRAWLSGEQPRMPGFLNGRHAVVWARDYSTGANAHYPSSGSVASSTNNAWVLS